MLLIAKRFGILLILSAQLFCACSAAPVILDTGHTPARPGARGVSGKTEYAFNLELSAAVSRELVESGVDVIRVSADGKEIDLARRPNVEPTASLFVSIHHDSIQQEWIDAGRRSEFSGYSLFVSEKNPAYDRSLRCAENLGERLRGAGEQPSLYHSTPIPGENRPLIDKRLGIHRFDDLIVLKTAQMPAVLIEAGVIANPSEEVRLSQPETIRRLAHAIAEGVRQCVGL